MFNIWMINLLREATNVQVAVTRILGAPIGFNVPKILQLYCNDLVCDYRVSQAGMLNLLFNSSCVSRA